MSPTSKKIVGYWHYGVILTYTSLLSAIIGIIFSAMGKPDIGVICLFISGICDAFDGTVAKTRKNRDDGDKSFGAQIDSLSDFVAFGIAPIMVGVGLGLTEWYYIVIYCIYGLFALIRLAFYNVTEESYIAEGTQRTFYEGLPVTNITYILPPVFIVATMFLSPALVDYKVILNILMGLVYVITAVLFVVRFRCPKWKPLTIAISIVITVAIMLGLYLVRSYVCDVQMIW